MMDRSTEKLVVFAVLGFLHALKEGKCHPDEVFRVFGQPGVLSAMRTAGVRSEIVDLMNGLDELDVLRDAGGQKAWNDALTQEIESCGRLLVLLGAPDTDSEKPLMHLFASSTNEKRLRESIAEFGAGQGVERSLIE